MYILGALLLSMIMALYTLVHGFDYCNKEAELCGGLTGVHIMCNKEQIEPASYYQKHILISHKLRDLFTYWHNYHRNEVACGNAKGADGTLPKAKQMRELVWDYELAHLAHVHAGRCNSKHDICRNTARFPISGQNLWYTSSSDGAVSPVDYTYLSALDWFNESINCSLSVIAAYAVGEATFGHFTMMSNDQVGRLGCAMSWGIDARNWNNIYVTCNYDYTNVQTLPVYLQGDPASNCDIYGSYGVSSNFSCLCTKTYKENNSSVFFF